MSDGWLKELVFGDGRTPRTDKLFRTNTEWLEFSRQLELELNEAIRDRKLWEANWEAMKLERDSLKAALREALDLGTRHHYDCEDCWYACSTLTCDEDRRSDKCDCGADNINALLAALRAQFLDDK